MALALLSEITLLSWADLSYVLPLTSIVYVLTACCGWCFLHESISAVRWTGIGLISLGAALVARTSAYGRRQVAETAQ